MLCSLVTTPGSLANPKKAGDDVDADVGGDDDDDRDDDDDAASTN